MYIVSTDSDYPFEHRLSYDYPYDGECRTFDLQEIKRELIALNPAKGSFLFLEDTTGITLRFKSACELFHFRLIDEFDSHCDDNSNEYPIDQSFCLVGKKDRDKRPLIKVKNHFEKTRRQIGIYKDSYRTEVVPRDNALYVEASSITDHLRIWTHLPPNTRSRLDLAR